MKKKCTSSLLLCLIFCVLTGTILGQDDGFEFRPGSKFKGAYSSWESFVTASKTASRALIAFADEEDVYYFLVDTAFRTVSQYAESKDSLACNYFKDKFRVIGQSFKGDSFKTFILQKNGNEIYTESPDFTNGVSVFEKYLTFGSKETFLTSWSENGHLYFLTHPKRSGELRFYEDSNPIPRTVTLTLHDTLPDIDLEKDLKEIKIIRETREPSLMTVQGKVKLYIRPGRPLVLTVDNSHKYTVLWKFTLNDSASEGKVMMKNVFYCNYVSSETDLQSNSYVYQDRILQAMFCNKDLLMQYKDIATDSVIMEFHATRDSIIRFATSMLITRGDPNAGNSINFGRKYDDKKAFNSYDLRSKDLFRAINGSSLAFLLVPQDSYLILKIGEAHEVTTQTSGMSFRTFGGSAGSLLGMAVSVGGSLGVYMSRTNMSETYIMTVLQPDNLAQVQAIDIRTDYDKLATVEFNVKDVAVAGTNFEFNGKTYFFYWDKKTKKLMIDPVL